MNLAFRFPVIFWNCACLISDSGGSEREEENEIEEINCYEEEYDSFEDFNEEEEEEDEEEEIVVKKKKKASKSANYGKIASAIGKMKMSGIEVSPPDVNKSEYTFSPDPINSIIRYGLSGIVKVGEDVIQSIIENRPYSSMDDFISKVKITKPQMINLIKAGAFDSFGDREKIMHDYVNEISDAKKRITLQNMKMLIDFELIPPEYSMQCKVFNFNKYLKKFKDGNDYLLDENAYPFYEKNFDIDNLIVSEVAPSGFAIKQTVWDKIYKKQMDIVRPFIQKHNEELLQAVNQKLTEEVWNKYCLGNVSKWEMDSVSFYSHEHELANAKMYYYNIDDFYEMPENPEIDRVINIKGKQIPLFKIKRIAGTVLDKNKDKKTVTLLTTSGVVTVKIYGGVFSYYDKQLSERGADGKKHVIEKSWLSRGNKIIVTGIRQEDSFVAKKYSRTPYHLVEVITEINDNGTLVTRGERVGVEAE